MYSSNSSHNGNDPISFSDQPFSCATFLKHGNCNSKQENSSHLSPPPPPLPLPPPPLFFHFPSPLDDDQIFIQDPRDLLLHQSIAEAVVNNMEASISNKIPTNKGQRTNSEQIPRKRSCKRDRHSKINTARGLRDRRMRLSLEVARRFFGLQDMLGFDKASKTVEWLLNRAKDEIQQLAREKNHLSFNNAGVKSVSSTSECEEVSGLDEVAVSKSLEQEAVRSVKIRRIKRSRKSTFHPFAKESREKARERARERTKEKMRSRRLLADESKQHNEETNHDVSKLGSWNPFENGEESGNQNQNMNMAHEVEERSSQATEHLGSTGNDMAHDDPLVILNKWSPTMIFNSLNNSGMLQEHQFIAEFQSFSKPWEAYNNHI